MILEIKPFIKFFEHQHSSFLVYGWIPYTIAQTYVPDGRPEVSDVISATENHFLEEGWGVLRNKYAQIDKQ